MGAAWAGERAGASSDRSMSRSASGSAFGGGGGCDLGRRDCVGLLRVVTRVRFVVSSDGGGGRDVRTDARQRKHSPLPK